nr:hypothetical protein CFP56_10038 [Quercus suber]
MFHPSPKPHRHAGDFSKGIKSSVVCNSKHERLPLAIRQLIALEISEASGSTICDDLRALLEPRRAD